MKWIEMLEKFRVVQERQRRVGGVGERGQVEKVRAEGTGGGRSTTPNAGRGGGAGRGTAAGRGVVRRGGARR